MSPKKEYGDFQTPFRLRDASRRWLKQKKMHFGTIVEPTCGRGAFCRLLSSFLASRLITGDLMSMPTTWKQLVLPFRSSDRPLRLFSSVTSIYQLERIPLSEQSGPLLIIGNPPWITNAGMGVIGGNNLPRSPTFRDITALTP